MPSFRATQGFPVPIFHGRKLKSGLVTETRPGAGVTLWRTTCPSLQGLYWLVLESPQHRSQVITNTKWRLEGKRTKSTPGAHPNYGLWRSRRRPMHIYLHIQKPTNFLECERPRPLNRGPQVPAPVTLYLPAPWQRLNSQGLACANLVTPSHD